MISDEKDISSICAVYMKTLGHINFYFLNLYNYIKETMDYRIRSFLWSPIAGSVSLTLIYRNRMYIDNIEYDTPIQHTIGLTRYYALFQLK